MMYMLLFGFVKYMSQKLTLYEKLISECGEIVWKVRIDVFDIHCFAVIFINYIVKFI